MVFQHLNAETVGLKVGATTVQLKDGSIKVGDRTIDGPGEYDIAGIGIHVTGSLAILFTEGIRVAVVWNGGAKLEEEIEIDVILFFSADAKQVTEVIKEQDPRIVVLTNASIAASVAEQDGVLVENVSSYKLTQQTLPSENRAFVLLA